MKICFPTLDARGLAAQLSGHFGRSPYFTLVDSVRGSVETLGNPRAVHAAGSCSSADLLRDRAIGAVVCRGLGGGAFSRLAAMGVPVYLSDRADVTSALEDYRLGRARPMGATQACAGHHDHESCGH